MGDRYPPSVQRPALLKLVEALGSRPAALRRDECGDWRVMGRLGHIYAVPEGFQICFRGAPEFEEPPPGSKAWGFAKTAMQPFVIVTQDGDSEGVMAMSRLPTEGEAEIIRAKLGIAKKREISDSERARLAEMGQRYLWRPDGVETGESAPGSATAGESDTQGHEPPGEEN
jgi:hypothetical protein